MLIHQHGLGRLVLMYALDIGVGRFKRVRDGKLKTVDYNRLYGLQVRTH